MSGPHEVAPDQKRVLAPVALPIARAINAQFPDASNPTCETLAFQIAENVLNARHLGWEMWSITPITNIEDYFIDGDCPDDIVPMANPWKVAPCWEHRSVDDVIGYARSVVTLDPPAAFPLATETILHLEVLLDGAYVWLVRFHEEGAPFGEGQMGSGSASDLEQAEREAWKAAVRFLRDEGYSDEEIVQSSLTSGSGGDDEE
jgi:hypothetical protein